MDSFSDDSPRASPLGRRDVGSNHRFEPHTFSEEEEEEDLSFDDGHTRPAEVEKLSHLSLDGEKVSTPIMSPVSSDWDAELSPVHNNNNNHEDEHNRIVVEQEVSEEAFEQRDEDREEKHKSEEEENPYADDDFEAASVNNDDDDDDDDGSSDEEEQHNQELDEMLKQHTSLTLSNNKDLDRQDKTMMEESSENSDHNVTPVMTRTTTKNSSHAKKKKSRKFRLHKAVAKAKTLSPFRLSSAPVRGNKSNNQRSNSQEDIPTTPTSSKGLLSPVLPKRRSSSIRGVDHTGAFAGFEGTGVQIEGWLKQKPRVGVKGMKVWKDRYVVLYGSHEHIRYYDDAVDSAWGPIPLGEVGAIPLKLIQRISTPSAAKYRGCRFDITCRSSWGTHYADTYVSSSEDESSVGKTSRVYSFMADSPQTRVAWVQTLDSLLKRSSKSVSPRTTAHDDISKRIKSKKTKTQKPGPLDLVRVFEDELLVHDHSSSNTHHRTSEDDDDPDDRSTSPAKVVPTAVRVAVEYLETSTPGIEMKQFYQVQASARRVKSSLTYLNQFAADSSLRLPDTSELESTLDPITAGAIVRRWLDQMEGPVIPTGFFEEFVSIDAEHDPYAAVQTLKALVGALPERARGRLEFLLFHFAGVAEYAQENLMSCHVLGKVFGHYILREELKDDDHEREDERSPTPTQRLVKLMIANVESIF